MRFLLELPDSSEKTWEQIMSELKEQIKNINPKWTDISAHDPGITILELLADLKVKQQKAADTIGDDYKLRYLELLKRPLRSLATARTQVAFAGNHQCFLPKKTKLKANNMVFETDHRLFINANRLVRAIVAGKKERVIPLASGEEEYGDWYAFDREPKPGYQLYLGFDATFPTGEAINLRFNLLEDYPVNRNPINPGTSFCPIVQLVWEYYGLQDGVEGWHPLELLADTTYHLLFSGLVTVVIKGEQTLFIKDDAPEGGGYYFRCTMCGGQYDVPPRVKGIVLNCVSVSQRHTRAESFVFDYGAIHREALVIDSYLAYTGLIKAYLKENDYWVELKDADFSLEKEESTKLCVIKPAKSIISKLSLHKDNAIKIVAMTEDFAQQAIIGSSNGFINQSIPLDHQNLLPEEFELMVGVPLKEGRVGWYDWQQRKSFTKALGNEACYRLDMVSGRIVFGDNRRGKVPPKGNNNLLVTGWAETAAADGNILGDKINDFWADNHGFPPINMRQLLPAAGGRERETIPQAEARVFNEQYQRKRAINLGDFARLVYGTPGLAIKHVKALPLYKPGLIGYPNHKADNCVTLVVEPYSGEGQGSLTPEYKKNILAHLEQYRLITTKLYVIEPTYVGLMVYGDILLKADYGNAQKLIEGAIAQYIQRLQKTDQWEIRLSYGDIYGVIDLLACVSQIRHLTIDALSSRVLKTNKGDLIIPGESRFYLAKTELTLVNNAYN